MPIYEFQCQTCGELQLVHTAPLTFEAAADPCAYCGGTRFEKLVSAFATTNDARRAVVAKTDTALAREDAASGGCATPGCPGPGGACDID